jgi:hypothetical protein
VYRIHRTLTQAGGKNKYDDANMMTRVTFSGTALPRLVLIHGLRVAVRLYSPKLMSCKHFLGDHHTIPSGWLAGP